MPARTLDTHAHILDMETVRILQKEAPKAGFKLTQLDDENGQLELGSRVINPFPCGAWDFERRLRDMDASGFDIQVLSNVPPTFRYDLEPELGLAVAQIQNDQMAARVRAMPDRFMAIATLPMQAPELAAKELRRAMTMLGMKGAQIGAAVRGRNLDDPALESIWATAEELGAFLMVHPLNAPGVPGLDAYYLKNLVGNPFDSTVAAASLVFGGVLERHPKLTFCMVHGGGFTPYQEARWVHGWKVRNEPKTHLKNGPRASLDKLIYDTIVHDTRPLQFLVNLVGMERVVLGSDYPFDMGQYDLGIVRALKTSDEAKNRILYGNAAELLGIAEMRKAGTV